MVFGLCGKYSSALRMDGKTAIVTGSNSGIGKFTAMDLYKRGCRVIMACRNQAKAEEAKEDIIKKCADVQNQGQLILKTLDLSSFQSIRDFSTEILAEEKYINLLINNAGVMACPKAQTVDGIELQFGTNHLGPFLLTLLLLPRILTSTPARIINLSSIAHEVASTIDWDNLNAEKSYGEIRAYALSKLAVILFSKELARRLEGTGVNVYSLHPGLVNTDLSRHADTLFLPGATWMYQKIGGVFQKNVEQGAATTLYCALDEKAGNETGLYYADMKEKCCSSQAKDPEKAQKMWDASWQMAQLKQYDPFKPQPYESKSES